MRKGFIFIGMSIVGVGAMTALVKHFGPGAGHAKPVAAGAGSAAGATAPLPFAGGISASSPASWRLGVRHTYALSARMGFGQSADGRDSSAGARWSGTLEATVVEASPAKVTIAYHIKTPRFTAQRSDGTSQNVPAVERELALPFAGVYDASGRLVSVRLAREVTPDAAPLLRGLLAQSQFTMPPEPTARTWQTRELDSAGEYLAAYARLDERGSYSRQKQKYLRVMGPGGLVTSGAEAQAVLSSRAAFAMGPDGRLARLRLQEASGLDTASAGQPSEPQFVVRSELSLELQGTSEVSVASLDDSLKSLVASDVVLASTGTSTRSAQGDRDLVAGGTIQSLLTELASLPQDASKDRAAIQARLAALLRLEPHAIQEAVARIRGGDKESQMLIAALAGAGTPEAQAELVDLALDGKLDKATREQVLANLTALEEPTRETAERLRPLLANEDPEVRAQAGLAIGAAARKLGASDPQSARTATADLVRQLSQSGTEEEKLWAVRGLGNSGSPSALQPLSEVLASETASMREAAAQSLRFIPGPEADQLISRTIATDSSADVRGAALFAASFREPEAVVGSVERSARSDSSEAVRQRAIQTLGRMARESNAPLETLDFVANNDESQENRETARRILESLPPPSDP